MKLKRFWTNTQKYIWLIAAFGLAAWLGSIWLGLQITLWVLGIGSILALYSLKGPQTQLLRWTGARKLDRYYYNDLYQLVNNLARKAGLPISPDINMVRSNQLNAYAIGSKSKPVIGISSGLINSLNARELTGVLAHEISHIKNNDLFVKGMSLSFGNLTNTLSLIGKFMLLFSIPLLMMGIAVPFLPLILLAFSPILNWLLQMGLSRSMEFLADHDAAEITQDPMGLASALHKIESMSRPWWYQFNPINLQRNDWLSSHPNTKKRIFKLKDMSVHYPDQEPFSRPVQRKNPVIVRMSPFGWY